MKLHDDFVPTGSMACCETPIMAPDFFRFSDLPGELRDDISRKYFGSWDAVIEYDRKSAGFKLRGLPEYSLMLASRNMHMECGPLISQSYSGKLIVRDTKVCRERGFGFASSLDVIASIGPTWLLEQTRILAIHRGTSGMLTMLPWSKLESLQEVHLEGSSWPLANCYPCGLSPSAKQSQEQHVFQGTYDTWCIHGYNSWSLVPKPIADGQVRVVTVREGFVGGTLLRVRVEHKSDKVEVLDRYINSVIQPKIPEDMQKPIAQAAFCRPM